MASTKFAGEAVPLLATFLEQVCNISDKVNIK